MPSLAKELMLQELVETLQAKNYIFFAHYQSLPANEFNELRKKLEKIAEKALVVKNALARLAFKKMGVGEINGIIKGSLLLTVGQKDPQLISKALVEFAKGRENFELNGAYLEGQIVPAPYLKSLADLPSREVLIASVLGGMNAPVSGFVNVLGQLIRTLAIALDQIQKKKAQVSS